MYLIFEGFMLIALIGLITAFQSGFFIWTILLKTAASLFFVLAGYCGYVRNKEKDFSKVMLMAFFCSMAGDVFLAVDGDKGILFVFGVISFAITHVLFSIAFCKMSGVVRMDIIKTILVFIALVLLLCFGNFDFQGLLPVLIGYAAIISFMVVKALSLWKYYQSEKQTILLIILGGILFLVSDIVLLFWLFGVGVPKEMQSVNWILYYFSQGCLTAAFHGKKGKSSNQ